MVICGCSCTTVSQVFNEEQLDRHDVDDDLEEEPDMEGLGEVDLVERRRGWTG